MNSANDINNLVINQLKQRYVSLTQEDKIVVQYYCSSHTKKLSIIDTNLHKYDAIDHSHVGAMLAFVYKNSGVNNLLEIISDKSKFENIAYKAQVYTFMHKSKYKNFLIENFSDFLAFNVFIYDISQCKYGKQYSHKRLKKDWTVIYNNSFFIKLLLVHGYITFDDLYNHQGKMHPDDSYTTGCNNDRTYIVDYWLKEKVQNNIIRCIECNYTLDFSSKVRTFLIPNTILDHIKVIKSLQEADITSLSLD